MNVEGLIIGKSYFVKIDDNYNRYFYMGKENPYDKNFEYTFRSFDGSNTVYTNEWGVENTVQQVVDYLTL